MALSLLPQDSEIVINNYCEIILKNNDIVVKRWDSLNWQ